MDIFGGIYLRKTRVQIGWADDRRIQSSFALGRYLLALTICHRRWLGG